MPGSALDGIPRLRALLAGAVQSAPGMVTASAFPVPRPRLWTGQHWTGPKFEVLLPSAPQDASLVSRPDSQAWLWLQVAAWVGQSRTETLSCHF